jgi:hypothetical protein
MQAGILKGVSGGINSAKSEYELKRNVEEVLESNIEFYNYQRLS